MTMPAGSSRPDDVRVRRAVPQDVPTISRMLQRAAPETIPLAPTDLLRHLPEFEVVQHATRGVVGAVSMRRLDEGRAELRSLVIDPFCRGAGLGTRLVQRVVDRARDAALEVVCVTRRPWFFAGLGFREIPLGWVPEKPQGPSDPGAGRRVAMAHAAGSRRARYRVAGLASRARRAANNSD